MALLARNVDGSERVCALDIIVRLLRRSPLLSQDFFANDIREPRSISCSDVDAPGRASLEPVSHRPSDSNAR